MTAVVKRIAIPIDEHFARIWFEPPVAETAPRVLFNVGRDGRTFAHYLKDLIEMPRASRILNIHLRVVFDLIDNTHIRSLHIYEPKGLGKEVHVATVYGEWDASGPRVIIEYHTSNIRYADTIINNHLIDFFKTADPDMTKEGLEYRINDRKENTARMNTIKNPLNMPGAISPTAAQLRPNLTYGAAGRAALPENLIRTFLEPAVVWVDPEALEEEFRDPVAPLSRLVKGGRRRRAGKKRATRKTKRKSRGRKQKTRR